MQYYHPTSPLHCTLKTHFQYNNTIQKLEKNLTQYSYNTIS